ncbi:MAG: hypothetical protein L0H53_03825 [Candidatus Nitrosocosmicus sp.]|nr:hypothetical protein [Candidatus Nitrosocosmicus sp.]MDN5866245.1 hypothetical protein [Candidatus Nitrosocosmicus sp.]
MKHIEFYTVFEATKGLGLLRLYNPRNKQWGFRDHNYGSLKYYVTGLQLQILKDNRVGFMILDNESNTG